MFIYPPREWVVRAPNWFARKLAYRLPRRVVFWCAIRLMVHATTGRYGSQIVPELTATDALERWSLDG